MVACESLKTKKMFSWEIPKVVVVTYELSMTKFKSQIKQGFTEVVVTRAGGLREWLQGEL